MINYFYGERELTRQQFRQQIISAGGLSKFDRFEMSDEKIFEFANFKATRK